MRSLFDKELRELKNDVSNMCTKVERVVGDTIKALKDHDFVLARNIYENDHYINAMESNIERQCFTLIALQQPIATDLRRITACMKVITDIERIADQCADICEIMMTNPNFHVKKTPSLILRMLEKGREMYVDAIDSFVREDMELAREVAQADDSVDEMFTKAVLELTQLLQNNYTHASEATDYLFIAKYIERIADHATNIAEWGAYQVTGEHKKINKDEDED
mgnify:CR=1 FL=1